MKLSASNNKYIENIYKEIIKVESCFEKAGEDLLLSFINFLNIIPERYEKANLLKKQAFFKIKNIINSPLEAQIYWAEKFGKEYIKNSIYKFAEIIEKEKKDIDIKYYDLIIFDADKTLWDGDLGWQMTPPFVKISEDIVRDSEGRTISLKDGVKETLLKLRALDKDIGLVSHSEDKEIKNYENQPVLLLLKKFEIFNLFNHSIVVIADLPKSIFIPEDQNVLFVDDDIENLLEVIKNSDADVVDAKKIKFDKSKKSSFLSKIKQSSIENPLNKKDIIIGSTKVNLKQNKNCVEIRSLVDLKSNKVNAKRCLDCILDIAKKENIKLIIKPQVIIENDLDSEYLKKFYKQ